MKANSVDYLDCYADGGDERGRPVREELAARTIDLVYRRSNWLEGKDRVLVELVFGRGVPLCQIAHLMEISRSSVRRKIRSLVRRLESREYLFCLRNQEKFSATEREILRRHFVQGFTIMETARQCKCSRHKVYKTLEKVKRLMEMRVRLCKPTEVTVRTSEGGGRVFCIQPAGKGAENEI